MFIPYDTPIGGMPARALGTPGSGLTGQHGLQAAEQPEQVAMRCIPCSIVCHIVLPQELMRHDVAVVPGERAAALLRLLGRHAEQRWILEYESGYVVGVVCRDVGSDDAARRMAGDGVGAVDDIMRERNQRIAVDASMARSIIRRSACRLPSR